MTLLLVALGVLAATGVFALVAGRWPGIAAGAGALGTVVAAGLGVGPALHSLRAGVTTTVTASWVLPAGTGPIPLGVDPLTSFFLLPLLVMGAFCGVYGFFYMQSFWSRRAAGPPAFFFNLMLASMVLVLLARGAVVLIVAWELMTLTSYALVAFEHEQTEVRRAGWVYLIAGHIGVAFLVAFFLVLGRRAGGLAFVQLAASHAGGGFGSLLLLLAVVGFGVKAGVVPLHVWLPEAHAAAPSHVSALMSGVLIKLGVYGILRALTFLAPAQAPGPLLLALGLLGGLLGISLALYQRDMKRVLAYSSIENVGVMLIGIGLGLWGAQTGHPRIAALGLCGGLLHVWNHALMKGLMFLGAGSALHSTGSKDLERLGGLLRRMPATGTSLIVGSVAIAGLPPLNGFASEWLVYMGLLAGGLERGSGSGLVFLFVTAALAAIGVLASLCFVRLVGVSLLGQPRSEQASYAHESPLGMVAPLALLAIACAGMALLARHLVPLLEPVTAQILGAPVDLAPAASRLGGVAAISAAVWIALGIGTAVLLLLLRGRRATDDTWGCGYIAPSPRMQYTARSFAEVMAERLLPPPLRARVATKAPRAIFAEPTRISSDSTDPVTRSVYEPFLGTWARRFAGLRWLQQGSLHMYLVYILAAVTSALAWTSLRHLWGGQ
jgi:formate hydrogenlyase subunit 3/multisubunit Na+/H+ antiporter MnhD subunit